MPTPAQLLEFENTWPAHDGHKEEAIRRDLRLTPARYYALLHRAAESIDGQAAHPITARLIRHRLLKAAT